MDIAFSDLYEGLPIVDEDDDWFYEHIDAPKFVDFSAPDSPPIDDISWFCLRFGCDRQHEEFELDPEALHRDFTLRVMAARSSNVKRQRSLNKHHRSPGSIKKCPHSAPAKSVKGRTVGTNSISSIPNYSNSRLKTHPISSLKSTPGTKEEKTKSLIIEKKASMTPRSKGLPTKYVPSKSAKIGNGKVESLNHKDAAKASRRSSSVSKHGKICDGMKKLSIDSTKQNKSSMAMKKKIEAVSTQGDACKAISKVGVKQSKSAKIGNGKVESMKHNDAAKALHISNNTRKYDGICDGMKKLGIDSIKQNKESMAMKKKIEAVSTQGDACKAISKVGVKQSKSAKIGNGKVESMKHNDAAKALHISNSTCKYDGICDGLKKLGIDSIKQNKESMAMKKKIEAVSTQGDACKAISKVGVKQSKSAKIGNGKVESMKHNDAAKALHISNNTRKYDGICDGMKKLGIDSIKQNKESMAMKKKIEAVSTQGDACKAISKVGVKHSRSAKICNGKMESMKHNDAAKALLISNSTRRYDGICDGMKKLSIDSMKKNKKCMSVKKKAEAVSIQAEAISKVGAEHEIVDDIVPTISKEAIQSDISEEFLKVNEVVPQISKLDNSAEFDKDKENACTTRCRKISTANSESSENSLNSQHKENKPPVKKIKEATLKGKVKRSTDPKPFRLRTEERRIVKEANVERKMQVKSQKKILTTSRHGDIKNKYSIDEKKRRVTLEGPKDDTSKYVISAKTNRTTLEGSKDNKSERSIVKGANAKSKIQLKTQKKVPTSLKYNGDVKNQNAMQGKTHKTTLEVPKAKPNLPKAPRVRYVESRFGKSNPNIHMLQPETKETKVVQNKVIKTGSSIPNTQRVSNVRKTVISQAKVVERNGTMANAACLKGKRQSATNKETKFANSSVRG